MPIARHHAEWLSLLEISGPFLSMPVLTRAFPQGLDALDPDLKSDLRVVYEEWLDNQGGLRPDPAIHRAWVEWVLRNVLEMPDEVLRDARDGIDEQFAVAVAEHSETLRPDFAIVEPPGPALRNTQHAARLLVQIVPPSQDLEKRLRGSAWSASPATRMMTLLHATGVQLGLVTDGERWMLVHAPKGETTGFLSWYAELWLDEPLTLRAFRTLLNVRRFFGVPDDQTVEALLAESSSDQQEVTDQLGLQVRSAVEVLIQAIDLADQDRGRTLLAGTSEEGLYEAALKVMMRLVFLFCAEERGLLPLDDPFYNQNYAISTLQAQLRETADQVGEEVLERRHDAWCRLLATFRAVHGGVQHDRLALPAYGGRLFDPDEMPFLEGRLPGTSWRDTPAQPLPIGNRTVLHLLEALQFLQVRVPGGGGSRSGSMAEARRLSFRALDIEQIGHVYESLLDHTAKRAETPVLGLQGTKGRVPEIPLPELEAFVSRTDAETHAKAQRPQREEGGILAPLATLREDIIPFLREQTGRSPGALRNGLHAELDTLEAQRLRAACGNDEPLYRRVLPFAGLLREDSYGQPMVVPAGSVYVTAGPTRRATGTHYTPRSLTEPIVQHTLEPLVYQGPKEGKPREEWKLRSPAELLDLKICDMAMGSGAFLVQACRYLSERLVEAWEGDSRKGAKTRRKSKKETLAPLAALRAAQSPEERQAMARRLVAERCLYGVDKNHLAVEMAKLSLWLITLDKGRPFTFLDHALKWGDSIVGVDLDQLTCWDLEGRGDRKFETVGVRTAIEKMVALRREIAETPVRDTRDQEHKAYLLAKAEALAHDLRRGGDMLIASYYNTLNKTEQEALRDALLRAQRDGADVPSEWAEAADLGGSSTDSGQVLHPFHWPLEFPEVFLEERGGFDAFVGNPPFIGGRRIRETLGDRYRETLYALYPGSSGNADYCAFFFLRAFANLRQGGAVGLIATNTIAQGDTRETGLGKIVEGGGTIYHADRNRQWPGQAAVVVSVVHIANHEVSPPFLLDGGRARHISSMLDSQRVTGEPHQLAQNAGKSHMGSNVVGMGFAMSPEQAQELIAKDPRNASVLFPFINGQDLNGSPTQSASRWIINFFDWPLEKAQQYPECFAIVQQKVKPQRDKVSRKAYRERWWQYAERQQRLYEAIRPLRRTLAIAQTSQTAAVVFVPNNMVYSHKVIMFAFDDNYHFAVLQSSMHELWARRYSSTLKHDLSYTPTRTFQTFPLPRPTSERQVEVGRVGVEYHEDRRQIMLARQEGLTATYNRFHDPEETAADIARLRDLHVEMDNAVAAAYGWDDLDLGHGFHETPQGLRFTISQEARWEVLDRLLALNHERYAEEVRAGLHEKKGKKPKRQMAEEKQMRLFKEAG
jgi:hypothetical protein